MAAAMAAVVTLAAVAVQLAATLVVQDARDADADPIHFRYAWGRNPMGNLQSGDHSDLPFATQRSDDWKIYEAPDTYYANPKAAAQDIRRELRSQAQRELRVSDMERRLKEARTFIEENKDNTEQERKSLEEHKAKQKEKYAGETLYAAPDAGSGG